MTDIGWLAEAIPGEAQGLETLAAARLADKATLGKGGFALKSAAFANGDELDASFTAAEMDAVAPPLEWTAPGPLAGEVVIVAECPDAREGEAVCHWLVWGLPGQRGQILEGEAPPRVGKNAQGNSEWLLPDVEVGSEPRRYVFQAFASDMPLTLMPGATREDVIAMLDGHVIACALLTATFAGAESIDEVLLDEDDL